MKVIPRRRIRTDKFRLKWAELQKLLASKETWALAVINADQLLDEALKKKHCKGKSMGERLVSVQRELTDNDAVWFAHNLAKKILSEESKRLNQTEVKKSLLGVGKALRDLGVINE